MVRGGMLLLAALVLFVPSGAALAGEPPVPIEGRLMVSGWSGPYPAVTPFSYVLEGSSDNVAPTAVVFTNGDVCPVGTTVAHTVETGLWPNALSHVWRTDLDGSNAVDLTAAAGLGGINCVPQWSPDGTQVAFQHCDPVEGLYPCEAGIEVWVMNQDGSGAHRVLPDGTPTTRLSCWSPDGYRLLVGTEGVGMVAVDTDGTDLQLLPNVWSDADWSPDGSMIVDRRWARDAVDGEPGWWRRLVLVHADGTDPVVLVELFITDAAVQAHLDAIGPLEPVDYDWAWAVVFWVGPVSPEWSPRGDRIAFVAALPFDPAGPYYKLQDEVWVYRLSDGDLTKLTSDLNHDNMLSWNGDNTSPEDPEVTVCNTTVAFSEVTGGGLTTIIRDDDPPPVPTGFGFASEYYEISTTATISGPATVSFTYRDEDIPTGTEEALCILHYNEGTGQWEDITTARDPVNNIVTGVTTSLSLFGLSLPIPTAHFTDVPATGYGAKGYHPFWAFYQIEACVAAGLVSGYKIDNTYRPGSPVLREQMAVFLARALVGDAVPTGPAVATFTDVAPGYWAYDQIEYVAAQKVAMGFQSDGGYHPKDPVTRGQMAAFIARSMEPLTERPDLPGYTPPTTPSFLDVAADFTFYKPIEYVKEHGVAGGYAAEGKFHPEYNCKRDQMAVFLANAFGLM